MLKQLYSRYFADITEIPDLLKSSYLPSLDGFRGISILLVIIGHTCARIDSDVLQFFFNGHLGVYIFFVISGFLITTLLLKERILTGTISLKKFYIRRFLRIFPVAYLYLIVIFILDHFLHLNVSVFSISGAALYLQNLDIFYEKEWYTAHYWSLSIEEQYYLVFPSLLKRNLKFYCFIIPLLLVTVPIAVLICRKVPSLSDSGIYHFFHFLLKFDGVLTGSFFSILFFKGLIPWTFIKKYKIALNIGLLLIVMSIHNNHRLEAINHLSSFFIAIIIISNLYKSDDFIYRFLNNKILGKIGVLSYSLYIWQQLFTMTKSEPTWSKLPWYSFPVNFVVLFIVSYLSYHYYEKFFLGLKTRFKVASSEGPQVKDISPRQTIGVNRVD